MKPDDEVDAIMATIPPESRRTWCGGENGPCCCRGCVQVCNRAVMAECLTGQPFHGDPERIDERKIPVDIFTRLKITREEWDAWIARHGAESGEDGT